MTPNCELCSKNLGEVTKSRTLKGIVHLCAGCWSTVKIWREMATRYRETNSIETLFGNMFK